MEKHEFIHDASCTECGVELRTMTFPPHVLDPLPGGYVDGDGVFWPTCRRCGRIHPTRPITLQAGRDIATEARIAALEKDNEALLADRERFTWLVECLGFDVKVGEADPDDFDDGERPVVDAWRLAIDCAIALGKAESRE